MGVVGAHFGGGGVTIYPIGSQLKDHSFLKNNFEIAFNLVLNRSAPFCVVFQSICTLQHWLA